MPPLPMPLAKSNFSLNSAAVAGFFGGKEAISAMATVHLYRGRPWLGWYNSPGSYTVAKRFGRMANSRFWDGLFPGPNDSPAVSLGLDGQKGPQYIAALSGTEMPSRHLAYLTMEHSKELDPTEIPGRKTQAFDVTYLAMNPVRYNTVPEPLPIDDALYGLIPIAISVLTCIMCALVYDWYSFSMILLGIVSSGWASYVIGRGKLVIKWVKQPADGVPPGHGILVGEDGVMVIKGEERDVNVITKGSFDLETEPTQKQGDSKQVDSDPQTKGDPGKGNAKEVDVEKGCAQQVEIVKGDSKKATIEKGAPRKYHDIGFCSLLLMLQFLLQLLLIPQARLFGQIMFCVSLGVSWIYNSYLSSLEKEKAQIDVLFKTLGTPKMLRFRAGTRTTMAVFVCLLLFHEVNPSSSVEEDKARRVRILHSCLANETPVWRRWRDKVVEQLLRVDEKSGLPYLKEDDQDRALAQPDRDLLNTLLKDAIAAFEGYHEVRRTLPADSSLLVDSKNGPHKKSP